MEEMYKHSVMVWTIENFSRWNSQIHDKAIKCQVSDCIRYATVELYPKSNNGCLVVRLIFGKIFLIQGDLSYIGPDGSLLCKQQVDSKDEKVVLELPPGPKFEEVVAHIRKNEVAHGDRLVVQFQIKNRFAVIDHIHTTIDVFGVSFKMYTGAFDDLEVDEVLHFLNFAPDVAIITPISLVALKNSHDCSKILLRLTACSEKVTLIVSRVTIMDNERVVETEEKEHLLMGNTFMTLSDSLTLEMVKKYGFSLVLYFEIIPGSNHRHSMSVTQPIPFKIDIAMGINVKPSGNSTTATSHEPNNSVSVLTNELMCLYQDQDFSDFTLKCADVSIPVHRNILSARSPVFKTMLSTDMREAASNEVDIGDLDHFTLARFITFLYTGGVDDLQYHSALKLYYAADKYQVPSLMKECTDFLSANVSVANVCDILSFSNIHQDDQLTKMAKEFIVNNFNEVMASEEWQKLMKKEPILAVETVTDFGKKKCVGKIGGL